MTIAARPNGYNLTPGAGDFAPVKSILGGVFYGVASSAAGKYIAVGNRYAPDAIYAMSTDGVNWPNAGSMPGSGIYASMRGVAINSSGFSVAVGFNELSARPLYATSSNGTTWTTPTNLNGFTGYAQLTCIAVNSSGLFVALANYANNPYSYTSSDGTTWTGPTLISSSAEFSAITVNSSGLFVAVGTRTSDDRPASIYSADGITWSTLAVMAGVTYQATMTSVTVDSLGNFVAAGNSNATLPSLKTALLWTSTNGITWVEVPGQLSILRNILMTGLAVNANKLFVAVGYLQSSYVPCYCLSSDSGVTWSSPRRIAGTGALWGVTVGPSGMFVAVGTSASQEATVTYGLFS